jgi:hypothetical protein
MHAIHNARIQLLATLLNTLAGTSFTVGIAAPIAAGVGVSRHWGSKRYWALPATSSELKCLDICWPSTKRASAIPPISGHSHL